MLKNFLLLVLATAGFSFMKPTATAQDQPFEGILTYKISFVGKTPNGKYNEYQKNKYGDTMLIYYASNGDFKKEYPTSWEMGIDYYLYKVENNKGYYKWRNMDTCQVYDCGKNNLKLVKEGNAPDSIVMGTVCKGYNIKIADSAVRPPMIANLTYYYPEKKEHLNSEVYKNYNDYFYSRYMKKAMAPYYKHTMDMEHRYEVVFELVKIEAKKLDPTIFQVKQ